MSCNTEIVWISIYAYHYCTSEAERCIKRPPVAAIALPRPALWRACFVKALFPFFMAWAALPDGFY